MKRLLIIFTTLLFIFSLSACSKQDLIDECSYMSDDEHIICTIQYLEYFDTHITLTLYLKDSLTQDEYNTIESDIDDILKTYHQYGDKYNTYDGITNIKTINDDPTTTHHIDQELYDMIEQSLYYQDEVNDLYNIALSPVLELWHDYRENCNIYEENVSCPLPSKTDLQTQNQYTNPDDITLVDNTITLLEHMSLDLGGMTKGYVTKKVTDYLDTLETQGYIFNNGLSNISISGYHPVREEKYFNVGITNPTEISENYLVLNVSGDVEIITSGDYQQYGITDGVKYHHIIDPNTLYPSTFMHSVTLVYNDALLGDIYSTALFNMTVEDALTFVNNTDSLEAVFYTLDGSIIYSDHFEDLYIKE